MKARTTAMDLLRGYTGIEPWTKTERRVIERALARANGNVALAAGLLGLSTSGLYIKLKTYPRKSP